MQSEKMIREAIEERKRLKKEASNKLDKRYFEGWIMALEWVLE